MAVFFVNEGRNNLLNVITSESEVNARIVLFVSGPTIDNATAFADLSIADFSGYADLVWTGAANASIDGSGRGSRQKTFTFTHDGGGTDNTIGGWALVVDDPSGNPKLILAENFAAPLVMADAGNQITFDLTLLDELGT